MIAIVLADFLTKKIVTTKYFQLVNYNYGVFLGNYSETAFFYRVITLSSIGFFVLFLYIMTLSFLPLSAGRIKISLSCITGGILGNVIDRMVNGRTVDFIPFHLGNFAASFNLADIALSLGTLITLFIIFFRESELWYPGSKRKIFLIMPKHQLRLASYFTLTAAFLGLILISSSISFVDYFLPERQELKDYKIYLLIISILYLSSSFVFGLFISTKIYGPLFAFNRYVIARLSDNSLPSLKLRANDNFPELEEIASQIDEKLRNKAS